MKKFIFFASCIKDMGGAQMYHRNKCVYMLEQGWVVDLVSAQKGKVYIPELKKYDLIIPEIGFNYYLFSPSIREKIVKLLVQRVMDQHYDEILIESSCIQESTWAEVVAERCKAKHLCFILQEYNPIGSVILQQFVKFKHERHELAGIMNNSLYDMFLPFSPIGKDKSYRLPAYCNNVVEDIPSELAEAIASKDFKYVVGCLSRLDKPFIMPAIMNFLNYVKQKKDRYLFLLIGGAPEGSHFEKNIRNKFKGIDNVELIVTGYLFPVPLKLLDLCDAFLSSAGSAWVCMRTGVPTITYDGNDFKPIGILGRTTHSSLFRAENESAIELATLLDDILEKEKYLKESAQFDLHKVDFSIHNNFLLEMSEEKKYLSFENVVPEKSERKLSAMLKLLGAERYYNLGIIKKRIFNHKTSDR